ncbi:hypothetical protein [Streptomyces sp. NPDC048196]|uniref:hypothetical protein n=1 Tax=Streptomyces sp. NPDC048196 TaxID=3154712 RepID=UPI0033FAA828
MLRAAAGEVLGALAEPGNRNDCAAFAESGIADACGQVTVRASSVAPMHNLALTQG